MRYFRSKEIFMKDPIRGGDSPIAKELKAGKKYSWCTCGYSSDQPLCDGTHNKAESTPPLRFEVSEDKQYHLCTCKLTKNPPFCDGSHK